jgi:hypothetical protein
MDKLRIGWKKQEQSLKSAQKLSFKMYHSEMTSVPSETLTS